MPQSEASVENSQSPAEIAAEILGMDKQGLLAIPIDKRVDYLAALGFLAHKEHIGEPRRPTAEWTDDEITAVLRLFDTWNKDPLFEENQRKLVNSFAKHLAGKINALPVKPDRKKLLQITAECFSERCREDLGLKDFPDIELVLNPAPSLIITGG